MQTERRSFLKMLGGAVAAVVGSKAIAKDEPKPKVIEHPAPKMRASASTSWQTANTVLCTFSTASPCPGSSYRFSICLDDGKGANA